MEIRVQKGNKPEKPGLYLIKYSPGQRGSFCIEAQYTDGGVWYSFGGTNKYPLNHPEKIVGFIPWGDLRNLFGEEE